MKSILNHKFRERKKYKSLDNNKINEKQLSDRILKKYFKNSLVDNFPPKQYIGSCDISNLIKTKKFKVRLMDTMLSDMLHIPNNIDLIFDNNYLILQNNGKHVHSWRYIEILRYGIYGNLIFIHIGDIADDSGYLYLISEDSSKIIMNNLCKILK